MAKIIRLTESDLIRLVKRVINEQECNVYEVFAEVTSRLKQNQFSVIPVSDESITKYQKNVNGNKYQITI